MLPIVLYHIVLIGRQWLIKDWNEGNMVVVSGSVHWNAWSIEQLKVHILRERQLLHLMVLPQAQTRGWFQNFILDYQNARSGAFWWWQWQSTCRLLVQRKRPSHIHPMILILILLLNCSLTNAISLIFLALCLRISCLMWIWMNKHAFVFIYLRKLLF